MTDEQPPRTLVACPLCGAQGGYRLRFGSTFRWFSVECRACGENIGECRADRMHNGGPIPKRSEWADQHWERIGRHAQGLRAAIAALEAENERLVEALSEYANPLNWTLDGEGIRRLWLEPGSTTPDAYNGFELARSRVD